MLFFIKQAIFFFLLFFSSFRKLLIQLWYSPVMRGLIAVAEPNSVSQHWRYFSFGVTFCHPLAHRLLLFPPAFYFNFPFNPSPLPLKPEARTHHRSPLFEGSRRALLAFSSGLDLLLLLSPSFLAFLLVIWAFPLSLRTTTLFS